ncbi:hypothetical protein QFC21_003430 [Naganishia friedmannii]|uniref:Uncharacterized protein n=1 Tax=Naganishia friedmannii TaxID=89922 RepID=A0ACC2VQ17_9TREE|nr:hypothetical protein QFC21_003430 [Naganishia friedmannii]
MNVIREINRINQREIELGGDGTTASWHDDYKDSAYVFVGGLPFELTEGDVITVMSQFGEIVDINMPRDKETGQPKGFAFIMYEDQRSTVLAVDNMNGGTVLGRTIRVDHVKDYKQPGKRNEEGEFQEPEAPSMNALPPVTGGSDASSSSSEEEDEDPMAAYIRAERKKSKTSGKDKDKNKKSKHDGETKEERKARKAAKKEKKVKKPRGDEKALKNRESEAREREEDVKPRVKREQGSVDHDRRRDRYSPDHADSSRDRSSRHCPASRSPTPPTPPRRSRRSPSPSRFRSPRESRMVKREEGTSPARAVVKQETEVDVKPFRNGVPDRDTTAGRRYSISRSPGAFKQVKREPSPDRDSTNYRRRDEHPNGRTRYPADGGRDTRYPPAAAGRREYDSGARGAADKYDRRPPPPAPVSSSYHAGSRADQDSDWRKASGSGGGEKDVHGGDGGDGDRYGARGGRGAHEESDYASWRGKRDVDRVMRTVRRDERRDDDRSRR